MNTKDKIELPPLPEFDRLSSMHADDVVRRLQEYGRKCARAAVEADRKKFGRNDNDHYKRRGSIVNNASASSEPVAYMFADEWGRTKIVLGKETAEYWCPPDENITPLYTAPQPLSESDIPAEPNEWKQAVDDELTSIHYTADSFPSAKEAVKALIEWHVSVATDPVFQSVEPDSAKCAECGAEMIQVRPGKWQHPDCSQSSWAAEPVKVDAEASVPSDMDIDELSREWGLASAAYPSKSMVRDFARALLARYK